MLVAMRAKPLFVLAGAVGGTLVATAAFVLNGNASEVPEAVSYRDVSKITAVLRDHGADGCEADATRVECRHEGRYVAGTVLTSGLTMDTALSTWRTGVAQSALGEQGPFAIVQGPNWLVTGPGALMREASQELGGRLINCDRPYGSCR